MLDAIATSWLPLLVCALLGYLLGSIPTGLVLTRLAGQGDIRKIGSGNIGTTNVLRTGRKDLAALTLLGDAGKGWLAVWLAPRLLPALGGDGAAQGEAVFLSMFLAMALAGVTVFLGHCYPAWLRFRGGKGVATYLGILLGFSGWAALAFAATWIGVAAVTRFSSLAALVATLVAPLGLYVFGQPAAALVFAILTAVLWLKHGGNIARLRRGEENRIGAKRASAP